MEKDREIGVLAIYDESHLNRWFYDQRPTVTLERMFAYPEKKLKHVDLPASLGNANSSYIVAIDNSRYKLYGIRE